MQKIPTLFQRDPEDRAHVLPEVNPECQWVIDGEGTATRKYDGTCVQLDANGRWWARREVKPGKAMPSNYMPVTTDPVTHKVMGWEPIEQSAFVKFHAEAIADAEDADYPEGFSPGRWEPGTYELIGPKINGNPERYETHALIAHAKAEISLDDRDHDLRTYEAIRELVLGLGGQNGWEGLVYHHPDGRMAKIKRRDFKAEAGF